MPYALPIGKPVRPVDMKEWLVARLEDRDWHTSCDQSYGKAFVDVTAERGRTVGLFVASDLADCYDMHDVSRRHSTIRERMSRARESLRNAAQSWSDFSTIEAYELYLNCLPLDILVHNSRRASGVTGTLYLPHHGLRDCNIYVIGGGKVIQSIF